MFVFCFDSPMAGAHRPAGRFLESAFVLAATIGPGPSHHPHGKPLTNRLEGGRAEARKRRGGRYFQGMPSVVVVSPGCWTRETRGYRATVMHI